jgi:hypothetical protein
MPSATWSSSSCPQSAAFNSGDVAGVVESVKAAPTSTCR